MWQEMRSRDPSWPEVTRKWRHLTGSHLEVAVEAWILAYTVHFTSCKAVPRRKRQSRDRKWRHVTPADRKWPGSDVIWPEVSWKWPTRQNTRVYCTFHFLQCCSSQEEAVTLQEMTSRDLGWPKATRKWRHLTASHLEVAVEAWKLAYTVDFNSCKAVSRRRRQTLNRKWRHVTYGDRLWPGCDVIWAEVTWNCLWKAENWRIQYISLPTRL